MGRYRLTRNYASKRLGPWLAGETIMLPDEDAQRIENETPGTLVSVWRPQKDRMLRGPGRSRDRSTE